MTTMTDTRTDTRTATMTATMTVAPAALVAPVTPHTALDLLALADRGIDRAILAEHAGERYACAHLAALRAATAVLAVRTTRSTPSRRRPRSVWSLLPSVAPELSEWGAFFAAGAAKRQAAEAGLPVVSAREADDLVRDAREFTARVRALLGLDHQPSLL